MTRSVRAAASRDLLKGIRAYSDEPLVSRDYRATALNIIDGLSTLVIGGNMVKILSWWQRMGLLEPSGGSGGADG